jgi:hypothetical protein
VKPTKEQKKEIYSRLLNVPDPDKLDVPVLAANLKVDAQSLGGMLTQMKTNPRIKEKLKKAGFTDDQFPDWMAGADTDAGTQDTLPTQPTLSTQLSLPEAAKPAGTPIRKARARKNTPAQGSSGVGRVDQGTALQNPEAALQNASVVAFAQANKELSGTGQHVEALGSDALQRWMQASGVTEMNGGYWQRRQLPSGETALVQVYPPKEVIEAEQMGNAELSQMMYRTLEGETAALMKKVAFNPEAFTYYSWAKRKGYLGGDKDFADFVNYCITLTMTKIFGARIGVVINTDNTLMGMLREKRQAMGVEYTT